MNAPPTLVIATTNQGKRSELVRLLASLPLRIVSLSDLGHADLETEETCDTLAGNALLKARAVSSLTGHWALADDSGLEVDALDGRPGVRSRRFAHEQATDAENNAELLRMLGASSARSARFRCALSLVTSPSAKPLLAEGTCEGHIAFEARGSGGFGYDPLFLPRAAVGRTLAELSAVEKNGISHRGAALAELRPLLAQLLQERALSRPEPREVTIRAR